MRVVLAFIATLLACAPAWAVTDADPTGDWFTEDHAGVIHVGPCGPIYCGAVVGISTWQKNGAPPTDTEGHSQCQLVIIRDMKLGDDGRRHGTVTNPLDGRVYDAELWVDNDVLHLRGYIGISLLGSTQHWERFHGTRQADCHFSKG